jgi:hypothetical protein
MFHSRVYAAARAVMRGTGQIFDSPRANEKKTVYITRPGVFSATTRAKQKSTWASTFVLMLGIVVFALSVSLFAVGLIVHACEPSVRRLLESRPPWRHQAKGMCVSAKVERRLVGSRVAEGRHRRS